MLTIKTTEEGLGNDDGHIKAAAVDIDSSSYNHKRGKTQLRS